MIPVGHLLVLFSCSLALLLPLWPLFHSVMVRERTRRPWVKWVERCYVALVLVCCVVNFGVFLFTMYMLQEFDLGRAGPAITVVVVVLASVTGIWLFAGYRVSLGAVSARLYMLFLVAYAFSLFHGSAPLALVLLLGMLVFLGSLVLARVVKNLRGLSEMHSVELPAGYGWLSRLFNDMVGRG